MNQLSLLTISAMIAFAGNSLLCRFALKNTVIDWASFTLIRIVSGALVLWLIVRIRRARNREKSAAVLDSGNTPQILAGSWAAAFALFVYAAAFSTAYVSLPAATGALLLFGAVQATMIGVGLALGERLRPRQWLGLLCALGGLASLALPRGLTDAVVSQSAPSFLGVALMVSAGVAWGIYSLKGRRSVGDPIDVTAGNFLRAVPMALLLFLLLQSMGAFTLQGVSQSTGQITLQSPTWDSMGAWAAFASGALASGLGYAVWYTALPRLRATNAATVQLSVPVIAAVGGIVFLDEAITVGLVVASAAILGGIALVIVDRQPAK